jgi:phosphoribosylanthranilate isomerase
MWIKICGNTTREDALLAASCGADAVGFVFAPSPRRVTAEVVSRITPYLPDDVDKFGVFVDASFDEIASTVEECGLTGVQLHSDMDVAVRLRERFDRKSDGAHLQILRVLHYSDRLEDELEAIGQDCEIDAILIDSKTAKAVGGTGVRYDWQRAGTSFIAVAPHLRLIAAGGLKPENVAEAIYAMQPWGVDVASGVEREPGRKDPARVKNFILQARLAAAELKKIKQPAEA